MKNKRDVALITGGGTGIGFAIAKKLHSMKKNVVLVGRRKNVLINAKKKLKTRCYIINHDISDRSLIPSLVNDVEKKIGNINILINNAGIHLRKLAIDTTDQEWNEVIDTNLNSVFALSRECSKKWLKEKEEKLLWLDQ